MLAHVHDRHDAGMREPLQQPDLPGEPLGELGILKEVLLGNLDDDRTALLLVPGTVGHAHPARS